MISPHKFNGKPTTMRPLANLEAERAVLGSMVRDNTCIAEIAKLLDHDDFHFDASRRIFLSIIAVAIDQKQPADLVTVANELQRRGWIDDVGGYGYLGELWEAAPTAGNAGYYAGIVRDYSNRRRLTDLARRADYEARSPSGPTSAALDSLAREAETIARSAATGRKVEPQGFDPALITSADFDAGDYGLSWLVRGVLVKDQPGALGGPVKSLKTLIGIDMAVSLAGARPFLGEFYVPNPCRVAVLSGESGEATLQNAARRIASAKGLGLRDLDILWGFKLPQLADAMQVAALQEALDKNGVKVLILDPLYLALLAGQGAEGLSASNLYQTGPLLLSIAQACLSVGCTPFFLHHFRVTRRGADAYAEPQLSDLAFSGIQEFARQWILLSRRSPFDPEDPEGRHELWLSAGGSAGHSLSRAVNVFEGRLREDFDGRTWRVEIIKPMEARAMERDEKDVRQDRKKDRQKKDDESKLLAALDELDPERQGTTLTRLRTRCANAKPPLSKDRTPQAIDRLVDEGIIEEVQVKTRAGTTTGYRRPPRQQIGDEAGEASPETVEVQAIGDTEAIVDSPGAVAAGTTQTELPASSDATPAVQPEPVPGDPKEVPRG